MHHFYNGLTETTRTLLDSLSGGTLIDNNVNEAYQLLENMTLNNCQWPSEKVTPKKTVRVHELDVFNNLVVQVSLITKKLQPTQQKNTQAWANIIRAPSSSCDFCNGPHLYAECQIRNPCGQMSVEQAQYLSKFPQP